MVDWLFRLAFVAYCVTVGLLFLYAPWTGIWDAWIRGLPWSMRLLGQPLVRGAVSGFGLVHLVWVLHDFDEILHARSQADDPPRHT